MASPLSVMDSMTALQAGGGSLLFAMKGMHALYQRRMASKALYDKRQLKLLAKVGEAHMKSGCSSGELPPEFLVDDDKDGSRPKRVDIGGTELSYDIKLTMRIELVELTSLLVMLEDGVEESLRAKPCALWQVVMELYRWMVTELPHVLDENRGPEDWENRIKKREDYLQELLHLCMQPGCELDPELSEPSFLKRNWADATEKERRERRFSRVMHTLLDHLVSIRKAHAKVMSERITADLLQQLEHSNKGVLRPVMHAALIVLAGNETPKAMVFSELAADTEAKWSWMEDFKSTALCQLLSDAIKTDESLQRALHLVDYSRGSKPQLGHFTSRALEGDTPAMVTDFLRDASSPRSGAPPSGLPVGKGKRAQELLAPAQYQAVLEKLVLVNLVHAHKMGEGIAMLRETQTVAKQLGEIMFARLCVEKVNQFLETLNNVAQRMVDAVTDVVEEMQHLQRIMREDRGIDKKVDDCLAWSNNIQKAKDSIKLAEENLKAVTATTGRIRDLTKNSDTDVAQILERWEENVQQFCRGDGVQVTGGSLTSSSSTGTLGQAALLDRSSSQAARQAVQVNTAMTLKDAGGKRKNGERIFRVSLEVPGKPALVWAKQARHVDAKSHPSQHGSTGKGKRRNLEDVYEDVAEPHCLKVRTSESMMTLEAKDRTQQQVWLQGLQSVLQKHPRVASEPEPELEPEPKPEQTMEPLALSPATPVAGEGDVAHSQPTDSSPAVPESPSSDLEEGAAEPELELVRSLPKPYKEGFMEKRGNWNTSYQTRWFKLEHGNLRYADTKAKLDTAGRALDMASVFDVRRNGTEIEIETLQRVWKLKCESDAVADTRQSVMPTHADARDWERVLKLAMVPTESELAVTGVTLQDDSRGRDKIPCEVQPDVRSDGEIKQLELGSLVEIGRNRRKAYPLSCFQEPKADAEYFPGGKYLIRVAILQDTVSAPVSPSKPTLATVPTNKVTLRFDSEADRDRALVAIKRATRKDPIGSRESSRSSMGDMVREAGKAVVGGAAFADAAKRLSGSLRRSASRNK